MFGWADLVIAFVAGAVVAVWVMAMFVRQWVERLRRLLEEAVKESEGNEKQDLADRVENGKIILLEVEVENNQFFCYNSKTNQFVCQGSNVSEIIENFKQRFPGLNAVLHTGNEDALKTLRQQLKEHRESSSSI